MHKKNLFSIKQQKHVSVLMELTSAELHASRVIQTVWDVRATQRIVHHAAKTE
jgi:hypothetical protein